MSKGIQQEAFEHVLGADGKVELDLTVYNLMFSQVLALFQISEILQREISRDDKSPSLKYYIDVKEIANIFGLVPEEEE